VYGRMDILLYLVVVMVVGKLGVWADGHTIILGSGDGGNYCLTATTTVPYYYIPPAPHLSQL
jgi:hypothetical protein